MKGALLFLVPALAVAGYSDLIAARDGSAVVFRYSNSFSTGGWYRWTPGAVVPYDGVPTPDGSVVASSSYNVRRCNFGGSTCWVAPACSASWSITTGEGNLRGATRQTQLRVSIDGRFAWFQQPESECRGIGTFPIPSDPRKNGVYALPGLQPVAILTGQLASPALGARVLTSDGRPLLLMPDGRLSVGDSPVAQSVSAREATISEDGRVIAWQDTEGSVWSSNGTPFGGAGTLGRGKSPRLSDDGRTIAFVSHEARLRVFRPLEARQATGAPVSEIALSGDGRWAFALDAADNLIRVHTETMESEVLVPRLFTGEVWTARVGKLFCPLPCYDSSPYIKAAAGHIVILRGAGFDGPGWTVAIGEVELPLQRLADDQVWFALPALPGNNRVRMRFFNHGHPVEFEASTDSTIDVSTGCLGVLHTDWQTVTEERPVSVGDILSWFVTGAAPVFAGRTEVFEKLWVGPAPGLPGMHQLNARVLRVPERDTALFINQSPSCSMPPIRP